MVQKSKPTSLRRSVLYLYSPKGRASSELTGSYSENLKKHHATSLNCTLAQIFEYSDEVKTGLMVHVCVLHRSKKKLGKFLATFSTTSYIEREEY